MWRVTVVCIFLALLCGLLPLCAVEAGGVSKSPPLPESSENYLRAVQLYAEGKYRHAARLAQATKSSPGLALAARATLAHATLFDEEKTRLPVIRQAETLARAAIDKDRTNAEAYRLLAICLGEIARNKSAIENFFDGSAAEAKAAIDHALALDPRSPWSHAVLGGWHAEIVAITGPILAKDILGATRDAARTAFETAIALEPDNPVLHYEYALALRRMGYVEDQPLLCRHLAAAASLPGRDAFERAITEDARDKLCSQQ